MDTSDGVCGKLLTLLSSLSSSMSVHATRGVSWGSFHVFLPCFKTYIEQCLLADDQVLSGIARNVDMGIVLRRKMKEGILFEFRHPFSGKVLKPLDLWDIWSFSRIRIYIRVRPFSCQTIDKVGYYRANRVSCFGSKFGRK